MGFKKEEKKVEVTPLNQENAISKEGEENANEEKVFNPEEVENGEEEVLNVKESEKDLAKRIDEKREEFNKFGKKLKMWNYVVTAVLLIVLVLALVLALTLGNQEGQSWITIVVLCCAIALLVGSFIFSRFQRKKLDAAGNEYVQFVLGETNKEIYSGDRFKDLTFSITADEKALFDESKMFLNIKTFKAINVSSGFINNKPFTVFDCAASILVKNRPQPRFLGRMFVFDLEGVDLNLRGLFQLKGKEYSYPVDDLDGLKLIDGNDKYSFYVNDERVKEILNSKLLSIVKKFKIDKTIIDVIVSLNNGKLFVGIDYADDFINVPTKESVNLKNIAKSKADLEKVIEIREAIK